MTRLLALPLSGALSLSIAACAFSGSGSGLGAPSGEFGATPGGVKDLGPARQLVANGQVPPPDSFLVEAMYSEHDLPLMGSPCNTPLCLNGAAGVAPTSDGKPAGWVQIGLSSNVDPARYERPSLTAILCVDVSASMGWQYKSQERPYPSPGRLSYLLLKQLASKLGPQDRVALVTYGERVSTPIDLTRGDDPSLPSAIDSLETAGSTNMEAGLRQAYAVAQRAANQTGEVRVFLFTDENPNVGATSQSDFTQMVADGAAQGTSLTVFGMGLGLRQDLMNAMAFLRGANAFSLAEERDVPNLISESWPWMASPLAYDLDVSVTPGTGFNLGSTYGFPAYTEEFAGLHVNTVFLSKKRGALLVRLDPEMNVAAADVNMTSVLTYKRTDGTAVTNTLKVSAPGAALDERGTYYAQRSVGESVAMALLVTGMRQAATAYATDHARAVTIMQQAYDRFAADAKSLADPALDLEVQLAAGLLDLMKHDAPQGNLYAK